MNTLLDGVAVFIDYWQLTTGIFVFIILIVLTSRLKTGSQPASWSTGIFLVLFVFVSILIRLAYVSRALFPSYFDSAQHYAIIKNIMLYDMSQILDSLHANYYHMGFHFLAAFFVSIFRVKITFVMLFLGQIVLALVPLPFFFITKHMTKSSWAGMLALVLSAFGWYMPAHAVDWGKYPALMSIGMILFVLCLVNLFDQYKHELQIGKRILLLAAIGFSVLLTIFVHSRSFIVLGIIAIAWILSVWWGRLSQILLHIFFSLMLITLLFAIAYIQRLAVLSLLFDPYLNKGIVVTALVATLSIFAYRSYPQLTFVNLMAICLLLFDLFIPVNDLFPNRPHLTFMDRPYVEIILFMPLSLLGGLGLAGLEKKTGKIYSKYLASIIMGGIVFHAFANYDFYPSDCCVIVGNDDAAATAWMADQLPVEARIGIASMELQVVTTDTVEGSVGADAGIWITPLTDRVTILLPFDLDFDQQSVLDMICRMSISHIFVGELGQTFDVARLNARPQWYRPLLAIGRTRVYEVIGCDR